MNLQNYIEVMLRFYDIFKTFQGHSLQTSDFSYASRHAKIFLIVPIALYSSKL